MSGFSRVAYLVAEEYAEGENGRQTRVPHRRRVFVNPFTISAASFYEADAEGLAPRCILQLRACDYRGEETIEYNGERLTVTDRRESSRGDYIQLTCTEQVADHGSAKEEEDGQ